MTLVCGVLMFGLLCVRFLCFGVFVKFGFFVEFCVLVLFDVLVWFGVDLLAFSFVVISFVLRVWWFDSCWLFVILV